jgi:hypothetical protein
MQHHIELTDEELASCAAATPLWSVRSWKDSTKGRASLYRRRRWIRAQPEARTLARADGLRSFTRDPWPVACRIQGFSGVGLALRGAGGASVGEVNLSMPTNNANDPATTKTNTTTKYSCCMVSGRLLLTLPAIGHFSFARCWQKWKPRRLGTSGRGWDALILGGNAAQHDSRTDCQRRV